MKLKKNDLQELKKAGNKAIADKLAALSLELAKVSLQAKRGEIKNVHTGKIIRRAIAQLKTL